MHTAMFDAWAHYEHTAQPTPGGILRRPESDRTRDNKREAVSYAAYRVLADLFPSSRAKLARLMMTTGYNPKFEFQNDWPESLEPESCLRRETVRIAGSAAAMALTRREGES